MFPKRAKQLYAQKSDFSLHMSMESQAFSNLWLFKDQTAPKHIGSYPQKGTQQQQTQTPPTTTNNNHWIIYPNYLQKKTKIDLQELQRIKSSPICRVVDPPFGRHSKKLGIEIPALHFFAFILWCAFFGCKKSLEVGGGLGIRQQVSFPTHVLFERKPFGNYGHPFIEVKMAFRIGFFRNSWFIG